MMIDNQAIDHQGFFVMVNKMIVNHHRQPPLPLPTIILTQNQPHTFQPFPSYIEANTSKQSSLIGHCLSCLFPLLLHTNYSTNLSQILLVRYCADLVFHCNQGLLISVLFVKLQLITGPLLCL